MRAILHQVSTVDPEGFRPFPGVVSQSQLAHILDFCTWPSRFVAFISLAVFLSTPLTDEPATPTAATPTGDKLKINIPPPVTGKVQAEQTKEK